MTTLHLTRDPQDDRTPGILTLPSGRELYTLERPWRNNRPFDSCVPDGAYLVEPYQSPKFGDVYILSGGTVSKFQSPHHQRYGILIHPSNKVEQLAGCIAVGMSMKGNRLLESAKATKLLFNELAGNPAMLFISGVDTHE